MTLARWSQSGTASLHVEQLTPSNVHSFQPGINIFYVFSFQVLTFLKTFRVNSSIQAALSTNVLCKP